MAKTEIFLVRKIAPMTKEEWERLEKDKKTSALPDTQLNRYVTSSFFVCFCIIFKSFKVDSSRRCMYVPSTKIYNRKLSP
jgi:hypothetical protein